MRVKSTLLALGLAAALQPAVAGIVSVGFEEPGNWGQLASQYASQGLSFSGDAWAVGSMATDDCDGNWLFTRPGSCGALLLGNPSLRPTTDVKSFTINLANGFVEQFGFVFGQISNANVSVKVYAGLNGSGDELGVAGVLTGGLCGEPDLSFCGDVWPSGFVKFDGVAHSVVVSGLDQRLMMDDLQFITPTQTGRLPEPASIGLALSAIGALGWVRRRSNAR
jgi:hypothetical protein